MHAHTHSFRHQKIQKATIYGAIKNVFLAIIKIVLGITGKSSALVADGVHSFSDLLTDGLVFLASHWGSQQADTNHPYGHQRIETAGSMFLAFFLMLVGLLISYEAIRDGLHALTATSFEKPDSYVLVVALISAILNEGIYQYTHRIAKNTKSDLLMANAWHHRSDAACSLVVLIGVAGALMGFHWLDHVAALIVGILIIHMGGSLAWTSISELVDTGVKADVLEKIAMIIGQTPGVRAIHQLRTRSMGGAVFVDVHVLVDPWLSVSEGHYIAERVHENLKKTVDSVEDVTVHIDSEDDDHVFQSLQLPSRAKLIPLLKEQSNFPWERHESNMVLHYWQGKISLSLMVKADEAILDTQEIQALLKIYPILKDIRIYINSNLNE